MKTLKQWFCWSGVASFLLGVVMTVAIQAADMRTVAVISVADLDTAVKTLKAVTTQAGYPDAMADAETQLATLQGFDKKQPIGIVIQADDASFSGYGFLPISDISASPLAMFLAMGEKKADGSTLIPSLGMSPPIYVKQSGKWVFVSIAELPKTLPADPVKLLEGMDKQYLLGVKANVANLPKDLVMGALSMVRMMAQMNAQSEQDVENLDAAFDQIETLLDELKTFSFGISVTPQNDIVIDTSAEVVAGSVMAGDIAAMASFKTNQIGFYQSQDSIAAVLGTGILNAMVKKQYTNQLASFFEGVKEGIEDGDLEADEMAAAKSVIDNVEAMLNSTIESGKIDAGVTWRKNGTLLVGATITDGDKLQQALEKSLTAVPEEFRQFVKLHAEKFEGFAVSTIAIPISAMPLPELDDTMSKELASKTLSLQIAVKDTAIALALGLDDTVLADLKKAIAASKTSANVPETIFVLTPGNLVDFLTLIGPAGAPEGYEKTMEIVRSFPPDAQISSGNVYSGNAVKGKGVVSNKLLPGIGKLVELIVEGYRQGVQFGHGYDGGDFDIDDFDL